MAESMDSVEDRLICDDCSYDECNLEAFGKRDGTAESFSFLRLAGNANSVVRAMLASKKSFVKCKLHKTD